MIIFDLNSAKAQPLETIAAMKKDPATASIRTIGFVSHVHTALIAAARQAGADDVLARSAFAGNLAEILQADGQRNPDHHRRHSPGGSAHQRPSLADAASSIRMAVAICGADVLLKLESLQPTFSYRSEAPPTPLSDSRNSTGQALHHW